jgi:hypothetical protein
MNTAIDIKLIFNPDLLSPVERACAPAGQRKLITNLAQDVVVAWQRNFQKLQSRPREEFISIHRDPFYRVAKQKMRGIKPGTIAPQLKVMPSMEPGGGSRQAQGFWSGAADATSYAVQTDYLAIVSVNKRGVRLRLLGGDIDKLQAIPAIPEAVGTNPEDWAGLEINYRIHGPKTIGCLWDPETKTVVWWLTEHTHHEADPEVIDLAATQAAVDHRVAEWMKELAAQMNAQNQGGN